MQKKKVLLLTCGNIDNGGSRIRAVKHFERLKDVYETTWIPRVGVEKRVTLLDKITLALLKRYYGIKQLLAIIFCRYDVVFIMVMFLPAFWLKILKRRKTLICYDFDDAVYTYNQEKFDTMMKYSDKVIVASPYLKEHIAKYKKNCQVIFSPVETDLIAPDTNQQPVFTIGWVGASWGIPYLQLLNKVFQRLSAKISFKLLVVGGNLEIEGVDIEYIEWNEQSEVAALAKMDVGIMPLQNTAWAKMKGGYKLYLYMAAGKPVVASPYGINSLIVKEGINGFLAETDEQWLNAFEQLYRNTTLRNQMGINARADAEKKYSYNVCTQQLHQFLNN